MSWSAGFERPVKKSAANAAIDELGLDVCTDKEMFDQLQAAKDAAKQLLKSLPGPYVTVSLSGHANGVGWQKKDGFANDFIAVQVCQAVEADLRYYPAK